MLSSRYQPADGFSFSLFFFHLVFTSHSVEWDVKPTLQKKRLRLRKVKELAQFAKSQSEELGLKSMTTVLIPLSSAVTRRLWTQPGANKKSTGEGRERERKKKEPGRLGRHQMRAPVTTSCSHSQPLPQHPDQTTTRLTFCSVSIPFRLQMFINTCRNVISPGKIHTPGNGC